MELLDGLYHDLKGINPSVMYKILTGEDYKLVVQPQRHLNPKMKEVVRKEKIFKKLLNLLAICW